MADIIKLRTIDQAHKDIKTLDPESCISKHFIRELIIGGEIPFITVHSKRLINLDDLMTYIRDNMLSMKERQQGAL